MRRRPQSKSPLKQTEMSKRAKPQPVGGDLENSLDEDNGSQGASSVEPLLVAPYLEEAGARKSNLFSPRSQAGRSKCFMGGITLAFGLLLILLMTAGKFDFYIVG